MQSINIRGVDNMGLFVSKKDRENDELRQRTAALENEISALNAKLPIEYKELETLRSEITNLRDQKAALEQEIQSLNETIQDLSRQTEEHKRDLIQLDDEILYQSFGLYRPLYDFATLDQYKEELDNVRKRQKDMISKNTACTFASNITVDGSLSKGMKMTKDNIKQILRSFNIECENAIDRVKFNNVNSMRDRIQKSFDSLNKLNQGLHIAITEKYLSLKLKELGLAIEYAMKKEQEKEQARQARAELREQQKLEAEIRAARQKVQKERDHYIRALTDIRKRLENAIDEEKADLANKLEEIQKSLIALDGEEKEIDYREKNAKAGYVYIISNIGSFGENVFKIGMTRRLEPLERIHELGDASVPFKYDIHALIFSEDAPKLEAALHVAFNEKRLNVINQRKEFYRVSLDEIKKVVRDNFDKTVDFVDLPEAEEFRMSERLNLEENKR